MRGSYWLLALCFAAIPIYAAEAVNSSPQAPKTDWQVAEDISKMDDSKIVVISKDAENDIDVWLKKVRPTLIIRCQEKATKLYMVTESAAQPELGRYNKYTVEVRIGDNKPYREHWSQSNDSRALFAPNAIELARKLSAAKRVLIRFIPFNAPPATAEFDLSGLSTALPKVSAACKLNTAK